MNRLTSREWEGWTPRVRARFFNSLAGPRQVGLLTSFSPSTIANAAVFSQTLHVGANPPQLGFLFRPLTDDHPSLRYVRQRRAFGFHLMAGGPERALRLHQCSAAYPEESSELDAMAFAWSPFDELPAPRIHEATVAYGLRLREEHPLTNGTTLVVGEVSEIHLAPEIRPEEDGFVRLPDDLLLSQGLDAYLHPAPLLRAEHARPDRDPRSG
jgi:flavin reductase (DIM6/NTAB) family NADH-FMN oxidoreductase RutF